MKSLLSEGSADPVEVGAPKTVLFFCFFFLREGIKKNKNPQFYKKLAIVLRFS